ncbi:S8 family serine peptidase [Paucibacter sp. M5-1]|uniref:S8 family serine peptidase n=1 Tax=Paucibacter sp. M5-1 TaxID=3015998 RepID=UPI0022B8A336|nr:S8 family serine peptidase [Paucibacter sp. M5-1]MCZ7881642.1 S8 family serine peptidase [Paucibacter sp. M5-1]
MKIRSNPRLTRLAAAVLLTGLTAAAVAQEARRPYIVQLAAAPAASYTGGVAGLAATKPAQGTRLDASAANVQAYISYLDQQQNKITATLPAMHKLYDYKLAFNGFAALLTEAEARSLLSNAAVAAVTLDEPRQLDTNYTPGFIGLTQPGGLWSQLGGPTGTTSQAGAGENIIVGVIDGGIWPESPSFADKVDANGVPTFDAAGALVYGPPPAHWQGVCETGEGFGPENCNNKLIGARAFRSVISLPDGSINPAFKIHPSEFVSPRDNGGHGTHVASTAAGNANVTGYMDGGFATGASKVEGIAGIAPRARVASYKVCWSRLDPATTRPDPRWPDHANGCYGADSIAAINRAIADGVHVLNYSISGSATNIADPVDVAFKGATDAGIFVAASAGNSGPANQVNHLGPWMTTVGNSTHDRLFAGTVTLGNGASYVGASSNPATPSSDLILAENAGIDGLSVSDQARLKECFGMADANAVVGGAPWVKKSLLDPAKVAGKLLVCNRGNNVLVNKSANGKDAGAAGVIIANVAGGNNTIINQGHLLSTVHVTAADGDAIKAYMAANVGSATGGLGNLQAIKDLSVAAPAMADGSSRGPNQGNLNVLKPDVTAPGTSILAAYTPAYSYADRDGIVAGTTEAIPDWSLLSGTSMSSPHIAGMAALLKHKHPSWSPAAIRSALMTTGIDVVNTLTGMQQGRLPWGQGAGFAQPTKAADPGLVYDIAAADYNKFLCGVGVTPPGGVACGTIGSIQPYNLNLPSLTAASVFGSITLTRTVTNVSGQASTYNASIAVPGFDAVVTPSTLNLAAGESKSFSVKLTRTTAAQNAWNYGSLTWSDGVHSVRSPVTARAQLVAAPASVSAKTASGNRVMTIGTGYAGASSTLKGGLKPATRSADSVAGTNTGNAATVAAACAAGGGAGVKVQNVAIPAATMVARFALYNEDTSGFQAGGLDDLDLVMVNAAGTQVGYSGNGGSNEVITLTAPAAGNYKVCTVSYEPADGAASVDYTLSSWVVGSSDTGGNFRVLMPSNAVVGGTASATLSWSGLAAGTRHLGAVYYVVGGAAVASTLVSVDTAAPVPASAELSPTKGQGANQH